MIPRPPRSTRTDTLFPYTTLFRSVQQFEMSVLDICAARNNNAQLTQETKSNKLGFYTEIRERLDSAIASRVEWKSNEWESSEARPIKVRDLLALAWIPLNKANEAELLPFDISVTPQNIYSNTGERSEERRVGQECVRTCNTRRAAK